MRALRGSPAVIPALLAIGTFLAFAAANAGFYAVTWYAGALFLLALLAVSLVALRRPANVPRLVLVAIGLLAAYAAWTYLSITWAGDQGEAWDGANRTALYLIAFSLFALWPFEAGMARALVALLGLGIAGVGLVELLRADAAPDPETYFIDVRLAEPAGYINANVALWTLGLWPCLFLASAREANALVRGLALGGAGLLASLALMGQSRGWALAMPIAAILFVALVPGRARALIVAVAVAAGAYAVSGPILAIHDEFERGRVDALFSDATGAILVMVAILAVVGALAALADRRIEPSPAAARRAGGVVAVAASAAVVAGIAIFVASQGSPISKVSDAWNDFKDGGQQAEAGTSRFSAAGTNRYDFWTVAWERFEDHPVRGVGIENFQQDYLRLGNSSEAARYPHSLQLGVLSQTGLVGAVLLAGALIAALAAAIRSVRRGGRAAAGVAATATAVAAYFLVHGSVDWFWEFPGLAAPAFAMLGLATALAPRRQLQPQIRASGRSRRLALAGLAILGCALAASLAAPWLAALRVDRAAELAGTRPMEALSELERAADLNPLSSTAPLAAGTVAVQAGQRAEAEQHFRAALERQPRSSYALMELGAIASERGRGSRAVELFERAVELSPRDSVARAALGDLRRGKAVTTDKLNTRILNQAQGFVE